MNKSERQAARRRQRATEHQIREIRAELHAIVDRCVDDWEAIGHLASMALSRGGDGEQVATSGMSDPTLSAVLAGEGDPARRWLEEFERFRASARLLDGHRAGLAPTQPKRERQNTVDVCARCGNPNPKMHRIDGEPHCATTCYHQVQRERRKARSTGPVDASDSAAGGAS